MFKTNSYFEHSCNYSFRDEEQHNENINKTNSNKPSLLDKLTNIEKIMLNQYQVQQQNQQILLSQAQHIAQLQNKVNQIHKYLGIEETNKTSRLKSTSTKTCRSKKSMEKSLLCSIEERKKVINQELTKRINDQLQYKINDKKPLKFFMPNE